MGENRFEEAENYIKSFVPRESAQLYEAEEGIERTWYFLRMLGSPQNKLKIIHVAGTSGKGSTCYLISSMLRKLGFRVGSCLSPHVMDIRERLQINNELIIKQEFSDYVDEIKSAVNKCLGKYGKLTYFELLIGLTYYVFFKEKVDYAIVETGMGGKYDGTNVVEREDKLCVITKIGLDHTNILGKSIGKIASEKAGIIHGGNTVMTIKQNEKAMDVIEKKCKDNFSRLIVIGDGNIKRVEINKRCTIFDFYLGNLVMKDIKLGLIGRYQAENCGLALTAVHYLSRRDNFKFKERRIRKALKKSYFVGRFDIRRGVIFDGAHNPEKIGRFIESLKEVYPDRKFVFLVAFKHGKDYNEMIKHIIPAAEKIIFTKFFNSEQDMINFSEDPEKLKKAAEKKGFKDIVIMEDNQKAFDYAKKSRNVVVTGSIYLISEILKDL